MSASKRPTNVKADLRKLADLVQREVDAGARSVEEIHRSIAAMPLDVLERIDGLGPTVKEVRKAQQASIGAIYKLIHKVNHEVGKFAQDLLDGRTARARKAVRRATRRPSARPAAAAPLHA